MYRTVPEKRDLVRQRLGNFYIVAYDSSLSLHGIKK